MNKTLHTLIAIFAFTFTISAQNINIPDVYFKAYLIGRTDSINTNNDNEISISEAIAFKGRISVYNWNIASLVGIENFINLTYLRCDYNKLTNLDVSKNTKLTNIACGNNSLISLNTSYNVALIYLSCSYNKLNSLNISKNTVLEYLSCKINILTSLDVSENTNLTALYCDNNKLTSLDVSKNTNLTELWCFNNQLTSLVLNSTLLELECSNNNLISLNLNSTLKDLWCDYNQLNNLDISKSINLQLLKCNYNINLMCIQILPSQKNFYNYIKDNYTQFNTNCNYTVGLNDETLSLPKIILAIYNLQGQQVNTTYQGLVIIRYTDGTSEKLIQ